jgi:hypothetical protein
MRRLLEKISSGDMIGKRLQITTATTFHKALEALKDNLFHIIFTVCVQTIFYDIYY